MQNIYVEPFGHNSRIWRTDGWTDLVVTNAALHYVARSEKSCCFRFTRFRLSPSPIEVFWQRVRV